MRDEARAMLLKITAIKSLAGFCPQFLRKREPLNF